MNKFDIKNIYILAALSLFAITSCRPMETDAPAASAADHTAFDAELAARLQESEFREYQEWIKALRKAVGDAEQPKAYKPEDLESLGGIDRPRSSEKLDPISEISSENLVLENNSQFDFKLIIYNTDGTIRERLIPHDSFDIREAGPRISLGSYHEISKFKISYGKPSDRGKAITVLTDGGIISRITAQMGVTNPFLERLINFGISFFLIPKYFEYTFIKYDHSKYLNKKLLSREEFFNIDTTAQFPLILHITLSPSLMFSSAYSFFLPRTAKKIESIYETSPSLYQQYANEDTPKDVMQIRNFDKLFLEVFSKFTSIFCQGHFGLLFKGKFTQALNKFKEIGDLDELKKTLNATLKILNKSTQNIERPGGTPLIYRSYASK